MRIKKEETCFNIKNKIHHSYLNLILSVRDKSRLQLFCYFCIKETNAIIRFEIIIYMICKIWCNYFISMWTKQKYYWIEFQYLFLKFSLNQICFIILLLLIKLFAILKIDSIHGDSLVSGLKVSIHTTISTSLHTSKRRSRGPVCLHDMIWHDIVCGSNICAHIWSVSCKFLSVRFSKWMVRILSLSWITLCDNS